jgi:hypothetical protein
MGQPVAVVEKASTIPGVVRFEANRTLTGQGHESFSSPTQAVGDRSAAELARRLFATDRVENVHVYSNVITVHLLRGCTAEGLQGIVRDLYQYWRPGMEPPAFAEPEPEAEAPGDAAPVGGGAAGGGAGQSDYERRIPQILIERSRAALEKWRATHGG